MKCKNVDSAIETLLNGTLTEKTARELDTHAEKCPDCRQKIITARELRSSLDEQHSGDYRIPEDVSRSFRQRLSQVTTPGHRFRNLRVIAFTAAAVLLFISLFMFTPGGENSTHPPGTRTTEFTVPDGRSLTIFLDYTARRDYRNVNFSISLDNNVSFDSDHRKVRRLKHHSWTGSLERGTTEIPFTVVLTGNNEQTIRTAARVDGFVYEHIITLATGPDGTVIITRLSRPKRKDHETG